MATSQFCTPEWVAACLSRVKAALVGLEKLSNAEAAAYLNAHPQAVQWIVGMPCPLTAAMIHEARTTVI